MKFEEVLPALRNGKKLRRSFWREDTYFYKNHQGTFIFKNGGEDTYYYHLTCLLDSDDWEVIEEPKKVKLRDLTEEQFRRYRRKKCNYSPGKNCNNCPFISVSCAEWFDGCWIKHKDMYSDKFLDQEIEIEVE